MALLAIFSGVSQGYQCWQCLQKRKLSPSERDQKHRSMEFTAGQYLQRARNWLLFMFFSTFLYVLIISHVWLKFIMAQWCGYALWNMSFQGTGCVDLHTVVDY
mmetsp:Transcript_128450/g.247574  ORF Transcript_128450/g.247574 Transcript_128450/m.247574 type:complete len:103 (+) Transcript_128450:1-309(+)